jgi:RNA recognition motif-containing protein
VSIKKNRPQSAAPKSKIKKSFNKPLNKPLSKPIKIDPDFQGITVYIGNLNYQMDERGIRILFNPFGHVKFVKLVVDPKTDRSTGIAFVQMPNIEEGLAAIKGLDGKIIEGRKIKVSEAIPLKVKKKKIITPRRASIKTDKSKPRLSEKKDFIKKKTSLDSKKKFPKRF